MKAKQLKVGVLLGGSSSESEVSRRSAEEIATALRTKGHREILIELDSDVPRNLLKHQPNVIYPALHGPPGEDGTVQGFLDILEIPYVGGGMHSSAIAMDKYIAKLVFRAANLPVLEDLLITSNNDPNIVIKRIIDRFPDGFVIKPLNQGSAIGVKRILQSDDAEKAIIDSINSSKNTGQFIVEPFVKGKEVTVGVLDIFGMATTPLPVIEITTAENEWYDYNNRYTAGKSEHLIPPTLTDSTQQKLQDIAIKAHQLLGLKDLSRTDYLVTKNNEIALLEVNSLPGMTPTSLYPEAANAHGIDFPNLIDLLVKSAYKRGI